MTRDEAERMVQILEAEAQADARVGRSLRDRTVQREKARRAIVDALCGAAPTTGGAATVCAGCSVRAPFEHRCHGAPCPCPDCVPPSRDDLNAFLRENGLQPLDPAPASPGESAVPAKCPKCDGLGNVRRLYGEFGPCLPCGGTGRVGRGK
jgi:hypothetical protein